MDPDGKGVLIFVALMLGFVGLVVIEEAVDKVTKADFLLACTQQGQSVKDCAEALDTEKKKED